MVGQNLVRTGAGPRPSALAHLQPVHSAGVLWLFPCISSDGGMPRPYGSINVMNTNPSLQATEGSLDFSLREMERHQWFSERYKVIGSGFRKCMLAMAGEWVGGGMKEAGRPQGAVPDFPRTDVGCLQHSRAAGMGRSGQIPRPSGLWTSHSWWVVSTEGEGSIKAPEVAGPHREEEQFSDNHGVSSGTFPDATLSCFFF